MKFGRVTATISCKIAMFEKKMDMVAKLCRLQPRNGVEEAFNNNARQTALFAAHAEMYVNYNNPNGRVIEYNRFCWSTLIFNFLFLFSKNFFSYVF